MLKGPSPRIDLSKRNLEAIKDTDLGLDETKKTAEKRLQSLFLHQNRLSSFPTQLIESTALHGLKVLYLNGNQIEEIPKDIGKLNLLVKLHLEDNLIKSVPNTIGDLRKLRKLYLNGNQLTSLPDTIASLLNLRTLHLHNNHIKVLTPFVAISNLKEMTLFGNPIESPPPFAYNNKPLSFLIQYLRDMIGARQALVPTEQFIYTRSIAFKASNATRKNNKGVRPITKSMLSSKAFNIKRSRAMTSAGASDRKEFIEDSLHISQNHLLYFLTTAGFYECQGHRDYMEDRCISLPRLRQHPPRTMIDDVINLFSKVGYFGVFDGHGGVRCANYLADVLHQNIFNSEDFARGRFEEAIKEGFRKTDEDFLDQCRKHYLMDGSTCAIALLVDSKLITAHAGDSRIVLCRDKTAIRLTDDHKPDRDDELARVERAGGEVIFRGNCFRVAGDLAMSRSFGDLRLKEPLKMVISEPEMRVEELTSKDRFLIIASDGLWDVLSDQKACDIVRRYDSPEEASKRLVDYALSLGTMDNTTAIVVKLNWYLDFLTEDELEDSNTSTFSSTSPKMIERKSESEIVSVTVEEVRRRSNSDSSDGPREANREANRVERSMSQDPTISEALERARSSTVAFRDSLSRLPTNHHDTPQTEVRPKGNLRLQITIPRSSVIKLMHFDAEMMVGTLFDFLIEKEKGNEENIEPSDFQLLCKDKINATEVVMAHDQKLSSYGLDDEDHIELRNLKENNPPPIAASRSGTLLKLLQDGATEPVERKVFELAINCFVWEQNHWRLLGDDRAKVNLLTLGDRPTEIRLCATAAEQVLLDLTFGLEATLQRDSDTFYELKTDEKRIGFNFDKAEEAAEFNVCFTKEMVNISANSAAP